MVNKHTPLSNCYIPLPLPTPASKRPVCDIRQRADSGGDAEDNNPRHRGPQELRRICLEKSISSSSATGSALVELGHTKVLCKIIGPYSPEETTSGVSSSSAAASSSLNMEEGILSCEVKFAPHFGYPIHSLVRSTGTTLDSTLAQLSSGRIKSYVEREERELSQRLLSAISSAVPLHAFPKNVLSIQLTILQDDGGVLSAGITAASLALVDAGIEIYDLVTSCTVAVLSTNNNSSKQQDDKSPDKVVLADPTNDEISKADAVVTLSILANWKEVTSWDQSGRLSSDMTNEAIELCRDGCRTMHRLMRNCLLDNEMKVE